MREVMTLSPNSAAYSCSLSPTAAAPSKRQATNTTSATSLAIRCCLRHEIVMSPASGFGGVMGSVSRRTCTDSSKMKRTGTALPSVTSENFRTRSGNFVGTNDIAWGLFGGRSLLTRSVHSEPVDNTVSSSSVSSSATCRLGRHQRGRQNAKAPQKIAVRFCRWGCTPLRWPMPQAARTTGTSTCISLAQSWHRKNNETSKASLWMSGLRARKACWMLYSPDAPSPPSRRPSIPASTCAEGGGNG
mmetsp:Transcript_93150/g.268045  ORF Transcript_93150/g.268045 Transcript_93150/m.268045 type:complete len:245 (-) Transcript_93150:1740-2474(-)